MAASVLTFQSREQRRLATLADHVIAHGNGRERVQTSQLLVLVSLGEVPAREAHSLLAEVRRLQQARTSQAA